jgi:monoamine oxidase
MTKIKRRAFIRNTVVTGLGASMLPPGLMAMDNKVKADVISAIPTNSSAKSKIVVAGAGITGLCCAYELVKQGHEVVVFEASGRHGGHVYSGNDGLSEGFYTDYGADHITKPGYEKFFEYVEAFKLPVLPYPNAEGSVATPDEEGLQMIDGRFYKNSELSDPQVLRNFGFNNKELEFLSRNPLYSLSAFYLEPYLDAFKDPMQPFGVGYDDLDKVSISSIYEKEGASGGAMRFLGGKNTSALYRLWRTAVHRSRGIPWSHGDTYRLQGGNQEITNAFARRLGERVKLNHPIRAISQDAEGISVTYTSYGYDDVMEYRADYLVNCITLPVFRKLPVTPPLSPEKQYVVDNLTFSSHPFYVFEASSRFWLDEGIKSINMNFEHPDISMIWEEPNGLETDRVVLKAYGPGGLSPQRVLAAFRELYPGGKDTIYQALTYDWTRDNLAPACEMQSFPMGELHRFWPEVLRPEGRLYFAGTYADNLSRGMESCIRSAQRVAEEISTRQ